MPLWSLWFTEKDSQLVIDAAKRESTRAKRDIRSEAWVFQQVRTALGVWSRQRETLREDGELPLQQSAPVAPGQPAEPKVLKVAEVNWGNVHRMIDNAPEGREWTIQVPERIFQRWEDNFAVMAAVNRLWHGAFPFDSMEDWAESLVRDAARSSRQSAEAEEERKLIREVYPEIA